MLKLSLGERPHACSWLTFHVIRQASSFLWLRTAHSGTQLMLSSLSEILHANYESEARVAQHSFSAVQLSEDLQIFYQDVFWMANNFTFN